MKTEWQIVPMGQLCSIKSGKSDTQDATEDGAYAFFDRSRTVKKSSRYIFDCEALIIPGEGTEFLPKHFIGKFDLHQRAYALYDFSNHIDVRFLYYFLHHKCDYFPQVAVGATVKSLRLRHFEQLPVSLTSPAEQQRIVAILDEAFAGIATAAANAKKNLNNARELFVSYWQSIIANPKYQIRTLGELCESIEYGTSSKSEPTGKIPVLRMGNIQDGKLDWDNLVYSNNDIEIEKYSLKFNDVLFNRTNSPELVGKTAIYKGEMPAIFAGYLIRIHRNENLLDADYLTYFLNSNDAKEYGKTVVISSVNQANINGTKLKSYPLPTPSLSEQKIIVAKLDKLSAETKKLETIYQQKLLALDELKKSILHQAFSGQLQ
jgi:type I restriction enzyme S subunit